MDADSSRGVRVTIDILRWRGADLAPQTVFRFYSFEARDDRPLYSNKFVTRSKGCKNDEVSAWSV